MIIFKILLVALLLAFTSFGAGFVNGNFETGDYTGWGFGDGYWYGGGYPKSASSYLHAAPYNYGVFTITNAGTDPLTGNQLNTVYAGAHSARINNSNNNYSVSVISQTVAGYTDPGLYFAWAAVLQASHGATDSDYFALELKDLTTNTVILNRTYNSYQNGSIFNQYYAPGEGYVYWTPWQIESIDILGLGLTGHDIQLSMLASDCPYGGHWGYAYLDGFGKVIPPPTPAGVPEPGTYMMLGGGLGVLGLLKLRKRS